jgi:hypothetical protein
MLRYHHFAELSGWSDSESLRPGYGRLVANLAHPVGTKARPRQNPVTTADTLTGRFCGGFKKVRPGDLSARIQDWQANGYRVKSPDAAAAHNQLFPAIPGAVERGLALRQLLGQFVAVCNAVAYAHSRGSPTVT